MPCVGRSIHRRISILEEALIQTFFRIFWRNQRQLLVLFLILFTTSWDYFPVYSGARKMLSFSVSIKSKMRVWTPMQKWVIKTMVTKFLSFDQFCHFLKNKKKIKNMVKWVLEEHVLTRQIQWCMRKIIWRSIGSPKFWLFYKF